MLYRYHYNPFQPRIPAGQHGGGQWTGGGSAQHALLTGDDDPRGLFLNTSLSAALARYTALSFGNSRQRRAVLGFKARLYRNKDTNPPPAANVQFITRDEVNRLCRHLEDLQNLTDSIAIAERPFRSSMTPTQYGTEIHYQVKQVVEGRDDPDLRAEVSYVKWREDARDANVSPIVTPGQEARYGMKGTLRIDVLERRDEETVCVYDIKTGRSGLSLARLDEIRSTVSNVFRDAKHIVITEVRPTQ